MADIVGVDTLLEGDLPAEAANYGSLAAHAAKTQGDWETELTAAEETRWGDGVLGGLFDGLAQGKPFVAALIEAVIHEVFEDISDIFEAADDAFVSLGSNFNGKWRDLLNAKDAADYANAQLAVMNRPIQDVFDGAAGDLNSVKWDVDYSDNVGGLAGGEVQQDGGGNAWWDGFGVAARYAKCRYKLAELSGDDQVVTVVMPLRVQPPAPGTGHSHTRLIARCNSAASTFVTARIRYDSVELSCYNSGTKTTFASAGTATQDGDVWDLIVQGTLFTLKRNGVTVLDYDDTGAVSQVGASYRYVGFEFFAESRGIFGQTSPGTIAVFSADNL